MGRWHYDKHGWLQAEDQQESIESIDEAMRFHHADCDAYEARIAELEAKLDWAQQIVKAQAETSNGTACAEERAAGNGGCGACSWCCSQWRERAEVANAELARVKAGPNLIQYDDELAAIYRIEDDRAKYLAMDSLCRRLASEADEMLEQTVELKQQLARVKAESLRVVPDGEAFDIDDLPGWEHIINDLYTHDGRTYINIDDERCYKVRLEHWETEE